MKKNNHSSAKSALAIPGDITLPSVKADDESGINFMTNVVAVCTLEAPSVVATCVGTDKFQAARKNSLRFKLSCKGY